MEKLGNEEHLWKEFISSNSAESRNKLFMLYLPWAKKISTIQFSKLRSTHMTWADSIQIGSLALLESLQRFNPGYGVPFEGFAIKRIKGALLNEFSKGSKKDDWSSDEKFEINRGEPDFDIFVDGVLDVAFSELLELTSKRYSDSTYDPLHNYMEYREEVFLKEALAKLPDEMEYIIESHYFNYLSFTQIAEFMELSRARVSQIHHKALRELRKIFEDIS